MGGNAIPNVRRVELIEYNAIIIEILELFPELRMLPTKHVKNKTDFGDIDFIVKTENNLNIKQLVKDRLNCNYYDNNKYFSFEYKNVQIDFNFYSENDFMTAYYYSGNGDIGNFIGKLARSINFKYGTEGLCYIFRMDEHHREDIIVSKDLKKIYHFLDLDYEKYMNGFETQLEVFNWISNSKLFNPIYFSLENINHIDRIRDRKRKTYNAFLEYASKFENKPKLSEDERLVWYDKAIEYFGDSLNIEKNAIIKKYNNKQEIKKYFNGNIITEKYDISGKQLGQLMALLNNAIKKLSNDDRDNYILKLKNSILENIFKSFIIYEDLYESISIDYNENIIKNGTLLYSISNLNLYDSKLEDDDIIYEYDIFFYNNTIVRLTKPYRTDKIIETRRLNI